MSVFILILVNGCIMGSVYAIMAMGLSTQYGVARILNIAHGEFIVLAALITYHLQLRTTLHPMFGMVISIPIAFIIAYTLHITIFRRVKRLSPNINVFEGNAILVGFGIYFIGQNLIQSNFGSSSAAYPFMPYAINIGGAAIGAKGLFVMGVGIFICLAYSLFLSRTRLGKSIRAAAQDPEAASMFGVKINRIMAVCFGIGGVLAACAGVLYSMYESFSSYSGLGYTTIAIIIIVFGGLGSVKGAILGGFILGVAGYTIGHYVDTVFMFAAFYIIILVLLVIRPQGLLGR